MLVKPAASTVATQVPPKRDIHHGEAEDSQPVVSAGADIPTALASCEEGGEALDILLIQKLIMNVVAESAAPVEAGETAGTPLPG